MFDEFAMALSTIEKRPCPRCGRSMAEYLELCCDCQWNECLAAAHQEAIDEAVWRTEMEAREADWRVLRDTQDAIVASMRGV